MVSGGIDMKLMVPLKDGRTLEFEGEPDELIAAAEKIVRSTGSQIAMKVSSEQTTTSNPALSGSRRWTEQSTKKLWGLLYGEQAKVVRFLVERGGQSTYEELTKHMGYGAQHLSGILSPLTRNSQTATGDRLARLVDWRIDQNAKRQYYIDPEALVFLQHLVKGGK
jgi:hypothetical protein